MTADLLNIIDRFFGKKVLVIGDFILDVYLKGSSNRLSPEAPVPVVNVGEKIDVTGGAANTAVNLRALGAEVTLLTVVGMDDEGSKAIRLIQQAGVNTSKIIRYPKRSTIVKTRVLVGNHVVTRFDSGNEDPVDSALEQLLLRYLRFEYSQYDAIVVSDYNKGVITPKLVDMLVALQSVHSKFIAVDSRRLEAFRKLQPNLVKPNYHEAIAMLALPPAANRVEQLQQMGAELYEKTHAHMIAVTLDEEGALVFEKDMLRQRVLGCPVSSPNVVGAGDTFVSAFALAYIAGAEIEEASLLASTASTIAVRKADTACCSNRELKTEFTRREKLVHSLEELGHLCAVYKTQGKRIVFTNGCFDILHSGHVSYLNRAKQLGDVLIVGVNTDESIKRIKGAQRPINPLADRVHVLSGLMAIDHIVAFGCIEDDTPKPLIQVVRPDIFVKGGDYTRDKLPEAETVEQVGGEIVFLSLVPDHSTTHIIQQIYKNSTLAVA
jgi:D-beta-D-heptose 7-phosphate kinase / D-beta-D-heptose 1-phosphate adenosyltransferase